MGMVMFCQFWYWYDLAHCACLAFEPTGIIGLDRDLKVCFLCFCSRSIDMGCSFLWLQAPKFESEAKCIWFSDKDLTRRRGTGYSGEFEGQNR